jgi:hypothetical protein
MSRDTRSPAERKERALASIRQAPPPRRALYGAERRARALEAGATITEIERAESMRPRFSVTERYLAQERKQGRLKRD